MKLNKNQTLQILKKAQAPLTIRHEPGIMPNGESGKAQHVFDAYKTYVLTIWAGISKGGAYYKPFKY